ncbi:MAG: cupin-like domain-containing protein [Kutzneria sp.]|nr:cupin-like domain-containing protein [Kutzneria sp.]
MTDFRLADLVAPRTVDDFLHGTYARAWARYDGMPGRFSGLASWEVVNSLLATQVFETPRFRVVREGVLVPADTYSEPADRTGATPHRRVVVERLLDELRNGASLVCNRVDQVHEPIARLAAVLESELGASVTSTMFASWAPVPGFVEHWDDHDVFVIQLDGRKHWRIYEPTRQGSVYRRREGPPAVEFDLTAGDVLYLPRRWWHSVSAVGEPSLHLTIGIDLEDGIDFLTWLVDRARAHELFRKRLPRKADERQKQEYIAAIRAHWNELIAPEDIVDQFLAHADGTSRGRPLFGLPGLLDEDSVLDSRSARVMLLATRATVIPANDGYILTALGRRWSFPAATKPLIDAILSHSDLTVEQLLELNVGVSAERSARVIFTLLKAGVVALR